jgi:hypothetical protein
MTPDDWRRLDAAITAAADALIIAEYEKRRRGES